MAPPSASTHAAPTPSRCSPAQSPIEEAGDDDLILSQFSTDSIWGVEMVPDSMAEEVKIVPDSFVEEVDMVLVEEVDMVPDSMPEEVKIVPDSFIEEVDMVPIRCLKK